MQIYNAARLCAALLLLFAATAYVAPAYGQSAPKLSLRVTPLGAAAGEKMIPVAATVGMEITLKNESSEPLAGVLLIAKLQGVTPADNDWKADGENTAIEIEPIGPNQEITRRFSVRVEMAPMPPGRQAEVTIEAKAGETTVNASARFPVGDCAAAFQSELTKLRISTVSEIWPTADNMRKPDTSLPRMRFFRPVMRKSKDLAIIDRLAAGYQARLLADHEFFREGVRYTARRWSDEMRAFTGQLPNPGICAVNNQMIAGIRKTIGYVTARLEPPQKAYVRAMDQLRKALNAGSDDDLQKMALKVAGNAGATIENAPDSVLKILEQARDLLKDAKPTPEQLHDLSLVESVAWVEAQAMRAKKLSDLIENSITGITEAQKKTCVCAF